MKSPVGQWHRYHIEVLSLCLEERILLCPSADLRAPPEKRTPQSAGYKRGTQVTGFPVILSMRLGLSKSRLDRVAYRRLNGLRREHTSLAERLFPQTDSPSSEVVRGLRRDGSARFQAATSSTRHGPKKALCFLFEPLRLSKGFSCGKMFNFVNFFRKLLNLFLLRMIRAINSVLNNNTMPVSDFSTLRGFWKTF